MPPQNKVQVMLSKTRKFTQMHNSLFEFTFWTLWMIWFPTIFFKKKLFRSERNKMNLLTSIHMNVSNLYLHRRRKICLEILIGYFCYTHYLEQFNGSVLVASKRISHQFIRLLNSKCVPSSLSAQVSSVCFEPEITSMQCL